MIVLISVLIPDLDTLEDLLLYYIYRFCLRTLEHICNFYEILAGTRPVIRDGEPTTLLEFILFESAASYVFWAITIIGMAFAIFFSIISVAKRAVQLGGEKSMGETVGQAAKTMLAFLLAPALVFVLLGVSGTILTATDDMFASRYETNLPGYVFAVSAVGAGKRETPFNPGRFDDGRRRPYLTGIKRFDNLDVVRNDFSLGKINMTGGIFLSAALVVILLFIQILLILRIFMIVLHYIVSPLFVASMALGDTELYKRWLNSFLARVFTGYGLVLSFKLIQYIVFPFLSSGISFNTDLFADTALKFLFVFGMYYAAYKSVGMLSEMINPGGESDEAAVMGTVKNAAVFGIKVWWAATKAAAKAALRLGYTVLTGGAGLAAALGGAAKDVAVKAVKEVAKKAAKQAAKTAGNVGKNIGKGANK